MKKGKCCFTPLWIRSRLPEEGAIRPSLCHPTLYGSPATFVALLQQIRTAFATRLDLCLLFRTRLLQPVPCVHVLGVILKRELLVLFVCCFRASAKKKLV